MDDNKILILLFYYNRPKMVRNALQSIKEQTYKNWELAFIDDGSNPPGSPIVLEMFNDEELSKTEFYRIEDTPEIKSKRGGSVFGFWTNVAIQKSTAEIAIMLCDDDALCPDYLEYLNEYYKMNPKINYGYCYVKYFDPSTQDYREGNEKPKYFHPGSTYTLNNYDGPIDPLCKIDASQVSWRTKCHEEKNIWFQYPLTRGLDADLFRKMYKEYGPCYPTFTYGQYKGAFPDQLGNRAGDDYKINVE